MLQPSRRIDANQPFTLTLVISGDAAQRSYAVPAKLRATATADLQGAVEVILNRHNAGAETLHLRPGQVRTVAYTGTLPEVLRGTVRIDVPDLDAAPVLVTLVRGPDAPQIAADGAPAGAARNAAAEATQPGGALGTNPSAPCQRNGRTAHSCGRGGQWRSIPSARRHRAPDVPRAHVRRRGRTRGPERQVPAELQVPDFSAGESRIGRAAR
ncbi:hypothetical protein [Ralstonia sp. 1B3]|uniref:hypothetical protein n=1 Tax=Ralstonia sp. 1B3 TaxID=2997421 RepID=UPI002FC5EFDB